MIKFINKLPKTKTAFVRFLKTLPADTMFYMNDTNRCALCKFLAARNDSIYLHVAFRYYRISYNVYDTPYWAEEFQRVAVGLSPEKNLGPLPVSKLLEILESL